MPDKINVFKEEIAQIDLPNELQDAIKMIDTFTRIDLDIDLVTMDSFKIQFLNDSKLIYVYQLFILENSHELQKLIKAKNKFNQY